MRLLPSLRRLARRGRETLRAALDDLSGAESLSFRCNICGGAARARRDRLTREEPTCGCGSTVRQRALIHALSLALFGESRAIPDFPSRSDLVGLDMSGASIYAERLPARLGYTNTFFHKAPRLDITQPEPARLGRNDFVLSSDVFEHIVPPVARAFTGAFELLKPGGVFVLTVPYARTGATVEHFPELHDFRIESRGRARVLINRTADGRVQEFDQLVFHGGEGETLEMRVFSESGVLDQLRAAGFVDVCVHRESFDAFGIYWRNDWSLPISARRPRA